EAVLAQPGRRGQHAVNGRGRQPGAAEREGRLRALAPAERVDPGDEGVRGKRQAVDVGGAAGAVAVADADLIDAVGGDRVLQQRVGAVRVVVLGEALAVGTDQLQARIERRIDPGGVDLGGDRLALPGLETPAVDVL